MSGRTDAARDDAREITEVFTKSKAYEALYDQDDGSQTAYPVLAWAYVGGDQTDDFGLVFDDHEHGGYHIATLRLADSFENFAGYRERAA